MGELAYSDPYSSKSLLESHKIYLLKLKEQNLMHLIMKKGSKPWTKMFEKMLNTNNTLGLLENRTEVKKI